MNRTTRIFAAAGVALTLALPASEAFAASHKTNNAVIGGALGALAGALIGHGSTTAVIAGAAGGALIGSAATSDRQRYEDAQRRAYRTSYAQPYGAYTSRNGYGQRYDARYDQRHRQTSYGYYGR
jgi:uncharacterized protein YcfJ